MINPYLDMSYDNFNIDRDQEDNEFLKRAVASAYLNNSPNPSSVVISKPESARQEPARQEDPLANIRVLAKPPVPANFGMSQPERNLKQAEEELNQAKIEDAQTGSEGYENKEDGVFNRMKNWGTTLNAFLGTKYKFPSDGSAFSSGQLLSSLPSGGKPNDLGITRENLIQALSYADSDTLHKLVDAYGGDYKAALNALVSMRGVIGGEGLVEALEFGKDWKERGIGALTGRAANLMETMAKSPYASMVDPTTVLGGQRTMVNDIDKYFNQRGLGALRDDLLKQDLVDRQTLLGQAERYTAKPPEERAVIDQFMRSRRAAGYQGAGIKNDEQLMVNEAMSRYDRDPERYGNNKMNALNEVLNEVDPRLRGRLFGSKYADPTTATGFGQQYVADKVKNGMTTPDAIADYRNNTGDYTTPDDVLLGARTAGTYKPHSMEEKLAYDRLKRAEESAVKKFEEETKPSVYKEAEGASIDAEYGRALNSVLDEAAANNIHITGGGDIGKALRDFGAEYGLVDTKTGQILGAAKVLSEAIFGNQMANIIANQNSGSISNDERRLFARQALNLGDSEEAVRLRLDLYILNNEIAKKRAEKLASLSGLDPLVQKEEFEKWKVSQYSKTADLIRRVVDAHMGSGFFDAREAEYAKQGGV